MRQMNVQVVDFVQIIARVRLLLWRIISRFVFTVLFLFAMPFSTFFWICYWLGIISDILDGFIARKMKIESETGSKL